MSEDKKQFDIEDLPPEQQEQLKEVLRKIAVRKAFIQPFAKVWYGMKYLIMGLFGIALIPVYVAVMGSAAAFAMVRYGWAQWIPVLTGALLAFYLPFEDAVAFSIAAAWAVGMFFVIQLVGAGLAAKKDEE